MKNSFIFINSIIVFVLFLSILSEHLRGLNDESIMIDRNIYKSIHNISFLDIDNNEVTLKEFKNKKILIVNTASNCGYTYQYEHLQNLHKQFSDKLIVIGVPSNDFMGQEPENEKVIKEFCESNYGVTFLLTKKMRVRGSRKHELFEYLTNKKLNGWNDSDPSWNFNKFLIDEEGYLINKFSSSYDPLSNGFLLELLSGS